MMLGVYNRMFSVAVGVENTQTDEERHLSAVPGDLIKTHSFHTNFQTCCRRGQLHISFQYVWIGLKRGTE